MKPKIAARKRAVPDAETRKRISRVIAKKAGSLGSRKKIGQAGERGLDELIRYVRGLPKLQSAQKARHINRTSTKHALDYAGMTSAGMTSAAARERIAAARKIVHSLTGELTEVRLQNEGYTPPKEALGFAKALVRNLGAAKTGRFLYSYARTARAMHSGA